MRHCVMKMTWSIWNLRQTIINIDNADRPLLRKNRKRKDASQKYIQKLCENITIQQTLLFDAYAHLKNISCNKLTVRNRHITISRNFATVWKLYYGNLLTCHTYIFGRNFVKITFLLKKLLKSWFDEIFFQCQ